jgi:hypothetical protein
MVPPNELLSKAVRVVMIPVLLVVVTGCGGGASKLSEVSRADVVKLVTGKWTSSMADFEECEFTVDNAANISDEFAAGNVGRLVGKGVSLDWSPLGVFFKRPDGSFDPRGSGGLYLHRDESTASGKLWNQRYGTSWTITSLDAKRLVLQCKQSGSEWELRR